ncbi:MAG: homocysteine S-methyltransferase family protein [Planctomycetes bacterium]|nr:homocysteine S-methyltransferase family protein [Planctomycetota bacterium]
MNDFLTALRSGTVLVMDGAMGTEIIRLTQPASIHFNERFNLTDPDLIRSIHRSYVDAGADVLLTNTFQANPVALTRGGLEQQHHAIWQAAIRLAREATPRFVLADVGPIQGCTPALVDQVVSECVGVEGVLLETWTSFEALKWFADRCRAVSLPLLVSFTFQRTQTGLTTFDKTTPEDCARAANECGAAVLGVNCGKAIGVDEVAEIVRRYRAVCDLPILVKPNAGTPMPTGKYTHTAEALAAGVPALLQAGALMVGGCCGTGPAHIREIRKAVDAFLG